MRGAMVLGVVAAGVLTMAGGCGGDVSQEPGGGGPGGSGTATTSSGTGGGQGGQGGQGGPCATDAECAAGAEWCVGGVCVPCDNGGMVCDIACIDGWTTYERNGCFPCACAPMNACEADADCPVAGGGPPQKCYAGQFCWDYCQPGDPSCCYGNTCSEVGCPEPNPTGCFVTGCPQGQDCVDNAGCGTSGCACDGQNWGCLPDCGGGTCVTP